MSTKEEHDLDRGSGGVERSGRLRPYAVGAAIGAAEVLGLVTARHPLGVSSTFEEAASAALTEVAPELARPHQEAMGEPMIDWQTAMVSGVVLGSALSRAMSGEQETAPLQDAGVERDKRLAAAFFGGGLMMFGARLGRGCTSGHGISGTMQLSAASLAFSAVMFGAGALAARSLLRGR